MKRIIFLLNLVLFNSAIAMEHDTSTSSLANAAMSSHDGPTRGSSASMQKHYLINIEPSHEVAYRAPGSTEIIKFQLTDNQEMVITLALDYIKSSCLTKHQRHALKPIFKSLPAYIRDTLPTQFTQNFSWQAWFMQHPILFSFSAITALSYQTFPSSE